MPSSPQRPGSEAPGNDLKRLAEHARRLGRDSIQLDSGDRILSEGDENQSLYILLSGKVQLSKTDRDGEARVLDQLGPGSLIGILSFWTGRPSFSDSTATEPTELLRIDREPFESSVDDDPEFARLVLRLLVANLSDRYRRLAGLNLKVAGLTRELESERNALRDAVEDVKNTRNQLVHKEKLATMGQLLAGIAHEINNPSSSLLKSVDQLTRDLPDLLKDQPDEYMLFEMGRQAEYVGTRESRERMERIGSDFPHLGRADCRRCARLTPEAYAKVEPELAEGGAERIDRMLRAFEAGSALHSIRVADERITRLVKGLKRYSRQDDDSMAGVSIRQCVQDTLMVLNHRLKHFQVDVDLPDLPDISARAGEINQILTNLLTNACEASEQGGEIILRAGCTPDGSRVWVTVSDKGHGISDHLLKRIFEPNVTTKSGGGQYGLGLGLAISRDLAKEHGGDLTAENRPGGGAEFRLELPVI